MGDQLCYSWGEGGVTFARLWECSCKLLIYVEVYKRAWQRS